MNVNKVIETEQGTIKFEGELEQPEADLVVKIGLNFLLQSGSLPIIAREYGASVEDINALEDDEGLPN